jgi:tetratricopeptide (TPR) repeat protein
VIALLGAFGAGQTATAADCKALTAAGRRQEAVEACTLAMTAAHSPKDVAAAARAYVGALMLGRGAPDADAVASALSAAQEARQKAPNEVWGYAAFCDVAVRIGDSAMLEKYAHELERVAPQDPETRRAKVELAAAKPGVWRPVLGALMVLVPALATLAHAMWRTVSSRARRVPAVAAAMLGLAIALVSLGAQGDNRSGAPSQPNVAATRPSVAIPQNPQDNAVGPWSIDDNDPEKTIPPEEKRNRDPLAFSYWLQDMIAKGQFAAQRGDHQAAVRYYRALVRAVPDRAIAVSRLCDEYQAIGERDLALSACQTALTMAGVTLKDYQHYISLVMDKPGALSSSEITQIRKALDHLREDPTVADKLLETECKAALRANDGALLERCASDAKAQAPKEPTTLVYQWDLAMFRGNYVEARQLVDQARAMGMNPASIERMEREMRSKSAAHRNLVLYGILFLICAMGAAAAGVVLVRRRKEKATGGAMAAASVDASSVTP